MTEFDAACWDDRYRSADRVWSGEPNPYLVSSVADLPRGAALDVGSGEGADAVWLARHGWTVTGLDISRMALDKAAAHAAEAGMAARITWQQADLLSWAPPTRTYDLVSAQYFHLPRPGLEVVQRALAAAVRPGGTLLIVGHHPRDLQTTLHRPRDPGVYFTAEQVGDLLGDGWEVSASAPGRPATDPDGRAVTRHDAVLVAVRGR